MSFGTVRVRRTTPPTGVTPSIWESTMNLREVNLSSRSLIPVALALPINRGPVDLLVKEERERRRREHETEDIVGKGIDRSVCFFI